MTRVLAVDLNACRRPQQELYRLLAQSKGLQLRLLVPAAWVEPFGRSEADLGLRVQGLDVRALPTLFTGRYHRLLYRGLEREVRDFAPDLLWVHAEPENFLAGQALLALRRAAPGAALALVAWRNIAYARGRLPYKAAGLHQWLEDLSRDAGASLLTYNADAAAIMGARGFDCSPIVMGVNLDFFTPGSRSEARARLGLPADGFVAGFVGRCLPEKGVDDLIAALAAGEGKGRRLLLVGDGPSRAQWLRQAAEAGVPATCLALPHEKVVLAMRAMDVLCLPSRATWAWKEQFGRVLIEAMACGTPVLGSDSGSIAEVIAAPAPAPGSFSRGKGGLLFAEGDRQGLAAALQALGRGPLARTLGREGLRRARGRFTWKAIARDMGPLLTGLAKAGRSPRLLGLDVFGGDRAALLERFEGWLRERGVKRARLLFYLNAHLVNVAGSDEGFRAALGRADLLLPDGQGVVLALRGMGLPAAGRLALGDVLPDLAGSAARLKRSVFLWGGDPGVAGEAASALAARWPGLKVAGVEHGFLDEAASLALRARLRRLRPDVLFLGMGSPKQERLALQLAAELPGAAVVVCGNAFTFIAGHQRRSPRWMSGAGLEWLWRLGLEPRRLAGRYLIGNLIFAGHALRARLAGKA